MREISIVGAGSDISNDDGIFRIPLPPGYRAGREVTLTHDKPDHAIHHPLFGKQRLPASGDELIEVRMLPKGSKLFWTHVRIEAFIQRTASESVKELRTAGEQKSDLSKYILELGEQYGFTEGEVRDEMGHWMQAAKQDKTNFRRLGLAAFAAENFDLAAENFLESARRNDTKAGRDYELAGDSLYNAYHFDDALDAYTKTLARIDRRKDLNWWRRVSINLANTHCQLGGRAGPTKANANLKNAEEIFHSLLEHMVRQTDDEVWAMTQNNLGIALREQGIRVAVATRERLLAQAVVAHRNALTVCTLHHFVQPWAAIQNNLGAAIQEQGNRAERARGEKLLGEAITAYRKALTVRMQDRLPQDWAMTQNNLGTALRDLAIRSDSNEKAMLFVESAECFQNALQVFTESATPGLCRMVLGNGAETCWEMAIVLEDWKTVEEFTPRILSRKPDDRRVYVLAAWLYHEERFAFDKSYALHKQWLAKHPDDIGSQVDFAETHFTTGRFAEGINGIRELLTKHLRPRKQQADNRPKLTPSMQAGLLVLLAAQNVGIGQTDDTQRSVEELTERIKAQPPDFRIDWSWKGTRHFITHSNHESIIKHRAWLLQLIAAAEGENRQAILKRLEQLGPLNE